MAHATGIEAPTIVGVSARTPAKLLQAAGLVTAGLAAVPAILRFSRAPSPDALAWALPLALFVPAFLYGLRETAPIPRRRLALAVESVAAISFTALARGGFRGALTAVVAGQAPFLVGPRAALALVGVQTVALAAIYGRESHAMEGLVGGGGYLGFQLFALGAAVLAGREAKAREELALANAELLATREANACATRTAERLRIARDLHDSMGHRLTALRLQLEVAKNSTGDQQARAIAASSDLSKLLLGEVREVVSAMREETPMDLEQSLAHLVASVPRPKVSLVIDPDLRSADPALTQAIFRFVQEAITNAARHADAETLVVEIAKDGDRARVTARDDGKGATEVREGNGLRGLRERVEELGGTFEIEALLGRGVELRALVPLGGEPA
jgi:signal transduction histidine kinase